METTLDIAVGQLQKTKNVKSFEVIYRLTSVQLFGVIFRILRHKEHSEECMQEVYLKIWQKIDSYQADKAKITTWLARIARNHAIDYTRKHQIAIADIEVDGIEDDTGTYFDSIDQSQNNQKLHQCLESLEQKTKEVLFLAYFQELSYETISKQINTPTNTIKSWVRRSLPVLKNCLDKVKIDL